MKLTIDGREVSVPKGHAVRLAQSVNELSRVAIAVPSFDGSVFGERTGWVEHPVALADGAELRVYVDDRLVAAFVGRGGVAVDPVVLMQGSR